MRLDFCKMTSSTGGTSTLTCSAQTGYPLVSEAFTGTRFVEYSIVEYTSSAKTQPSKAETGIGSYNTSTEVLTRTKVLSTWDATDYLPKFGTATEPTALNFGTTSANIDIMVGPMAASALPTTQFLVGTVSNVNDGLGAGNGFATTVGFTSNLTSGLTMYVPFYLCTPRFVSQFAFRETSALTGGSPTMDGAVYEVGSDGLPGKRLVNFTQVAVGTTNTTYQSAAIATPIYLPAAPYWVGVLYLAGGASGTMTINSSACMASIMGGILMAASSTKNTCITVGSQTALNDPATAATGQLNLSMPCVFLA